MTPILRTLLDQIDLSEVMRRRAVQAAITNALAETWRRRAEQFELARPRPTDFTGRATPEEIAAADARCRDTALACIRHAELIEAGAGDD